MPNKAAINKLRKLKAQAKSNKNDLNYNINNGNVISTSINGLHIAPFTKTTLTHITPWIASATNTYTIKFWASNINGIADMNMLNDTAVKIVNVGPAIPNITGM